MAENPKDQDSTLYDKLFNEQDNYTEYWLESQRLYNSKFKKEQYKFLKKKKRSKIFIPITRNTVNIIKAIFATAFFSNGNPIEIISTNDSEKELTVVRNKILTYYYDKYKPAKELIKAFHSSLLFGMGIVITYWDDEKKRVVTTQIPVTDIAFDNECANIDDIEVLGYRHYESVRVTLQKIKSEYYNQKGLKKKLFGTEKPQTQKRNKVKVIYKRVTKGYESKTFINDVLVRVAKFKNLPFQYGHAISKLADVDEDIRKDEILCYGDNIPNLLESLQDEINHKRNIKNDIQEKNLNPDVFVGDKAKVNPNDLSYGHGKMIKVGGDISQVRERLVPNDYSIDADIAMLAGDVKASSGVNSMLEGETGASDRRSGKAMETINANSSMRIEEMIMLIKDTLFDNWAKTWVHIVMQNACDKVINELTGEQYPIGEKGKRDSIKYDLKINFGMTMDKQQKINDKLQALQMVSPNPNVRGEVIEGLLKDLLTLIVGDDTNLKDLFEPIQNEERPDSEPTTEEIEKGKLLNGQV